MVEIELRDLCDGKIYHVCTDGTDCPVLMRYGDDYKVALNYLAIVSWRLSVKVVAYCLMSNHFHVLVICDSWQQAQSFIRRFKQLVSTYLLEKYSLNDAMKGVSDSITLIDSVNYLRTCIAYILRNPLCARIVQSLDEYPWSSYACYFRNAKESLSSVRLSNLSSRERRQLLRIDDPLSGCTFELDKTGIILPQSFVAYDIVENAFGHSGKSFLYYLGYCNDSQVEYDLSIKPQMRPVDADLVSQAENLSQKYFSGKTLAQLTTSNKCSIIKRLYYTNKTTIPQVSRVLGLPKNLVQKILST